MAGLPPCPPHPPTGSTGASTSADHHHLAGHPGDLRTAGSVITAIAGYATIVTLLGISAPALDLDGWRGRRRGGDPYRLHLLVRPLPAQSGWRRDLFGGVIDNIVLAFNDVGSEIFPFTAQHDLVSVVTQCQFWPMIEQNAAFVYANTTDNSPEIHCYFYNAGGVRDRGRSHHRRGGRRHCRRCARRYRWAALGCAGTGPFYFFCLLLACIIAAVIAAVMALIGAEIGGNIGHLAAGFPSPTTDDGSQPSVGDYITTCGKTIIYGADQGARVYWFVEHSALHGHSMAGAGQQWIHTDPDQNVPLDTCQVLCPNNFTGAPNPPTTGSGPAGGPPRRRRSRRRTTRPSCPPHLPRIGEEVEAHDLFDLPGGIAARP